MNNVNITFVNDFFIGTDGISFFDMFMTHIDKIIGGQRQEPETPYSHLIVGTALENVSIGDAVYSTKKDIMN